MSTYKLMRAFIEEKKLTDEYKEFITKHEEKFVCKLCDKELGSRCAYNNHLKSQFHKKVLSLKQDKG